MINFRIFPKMDFPLAIKSVRIMYEVNSKINLIDTGNEDLVLYENAFAQTISNLLSDYKTRLTDQNTISKIDDIIFDINYYKNKKIGEIRSVLNL